MLGSPGDAKWRFFYGPGIENWDLALLNGNPYSAPNLTKLYISTSALTYKAEPMIGAYFRL